MKTETMMISGNEALARGAIFAGCQAFFGYPITPQSRIPEFMSREMPKIGRVFLQGEDEIASIGMVFGVASTGERAMTSTSGPGFSLMQEFVSCFSAQHVPAVICNVVRIGPGTGGTQAAQTDYRQATKGGGHGGYRCIVLAPYSAQENFDLIQLAFHLSDKYRIVAIILSDATTGEGEEMVDLKTIDFGPLPEKNWAVRGKGYGDGGKIQSATAHKMIFDFVGYNEEQSEKYQRIMDSEVRYETYNTKDADILLAAYGYVARMALGAVSMARAQGLKVGLIRPITLWPFPRKEIKEAALAAGKVLVVEDSPGLFFEDVECAVQGQVPVNLLGVWGRHVRGPAGVIYPERILEEVKKLI